MIGFAGLEVLLDNDLFLRIYIRLICELHDQSPLSFFCRRGSLRRACFDTSTGSVQASLLRLRSAQAAQAAQAVQAEDTEKSNFLTLCAGCKKNSPHIRERISWERRAVQEDQYFQVYTRISC